METITTAAYKKALKKLRARNDRMCLWMQKNMAVNAYIKEVSNALAYYSDILEGKDEKVALLMGKLFCERQLYFFAIQPLFAEARTLEKAIEHKIKEIEILQFKELKQKFKDESKKYKLRSQRIANQIEKTIATSKNPDLATLARKIKAILVQADE